jgi:hypothetical protein
MQYRELLQHLLRFAPRHRGLEDGRKISPAARHRYQGVSKAEAAKYQADGGKSRGRYNRWFRVVTIDFASTSGGRAAARGSLPSESKSPAVMTSLLERIGAARESEVLEVLYAAVGGDPAGSVGLLTLAREEGYPTELAVVIADRLRQQRLLWSDSPMITPLSRVGLTPAGLDSIIGADCPLVWRHSLSLTLIPAGPNGPPDHTG